MTRAMKITFMVAAIGGFVVGAVYGFYSANELSAAMESVASISAPSVISNFARQQFEHADGVHARQAVLLEISTLEELERAAHDSATEGQLGFAYTRLAMIEEGAGQADAERQALDQARGWLNHSHPRQERTDEQMKSALKRWDSAADRL